MHATWSKADAGSPIRFVDDNGVVVRLAPGNTWIELVPNGLGLRHAAVDVHFPQRRTGLHSGHQSARIDLALAWIEC